MCFWKPFLDVKVINHKGHSIADSGWSLATEAKSVEPLLVKLCGQRKERGLVVYLLPFPLCVLIIQ
jgi:hypothetical protein